MEAHPALPQTPQRQRISPQMGCVKGGIAQPAAKDDPQRAIEEHIIGMALCHWRAGGFDHFGQVPIAQDYPRQIGKAIPAQREKPQIDPARQPEIEPVNRCLRGVGQ